jgi:hypothetical protein
LDSLAPIAAHVIIYLAATDRLRISNAALGNIALMHLTPRQLRVRRTAQTSPCLILESIAVPIVFSPKALAGRAPNQAGPADLSIGMRSAMSTNN